MSTNIQNSYISMYPKNKDFPIDIFDSSLGDALYQFGLIKIHMDEVPVDSRPIFILFTLDTSISMDELCKDGKSKMHHILNTFEHMVKFIAQHASANVSIAVDTFNLRIAHIIPTTRVTSDNAAELIAMVRKIRSNDSTDIELALLNAQAQLNKYHASNLDNTMQMFHVFLTDGEANHGITDPTILSELIQTNISQNMFIGYGTTHNSKMLRIFGETSRSKYLFIDHGENAGSIYGELMQRIMFPALDEVTIDLSRVTNNETGVAEIYNWKTNEWTSELYVGSIDSGAELTFHIRTKHLESDNLWTQITGKLPGTSQMICDTIDCLPPLVDADGNLSEDEILNIEKYMFRQKTMELMFKCQQFNEATVHRNNEHKILKKEMSAFFRQMRGYMRKSNLMMDPFMRLLCEDIVTCYKTMGTDVGHMYTTARQGSQGQQTSFTPKYDDRTDDDATPRWPPGLRRTNTCCSTPSRMPTGTPRSVFPSLPYDEAIEADTDDDEEDVANLGRRCISGLDFDDVEDTPTPVARNTKINKEKDEDDIDNYVMISSQNNGPDEDIPAAVYSTPGRLNAMRTMSSR